MIHLIASVAGFQLAQPYLNSDHSDHSDDIALLLQDGVYALMLANFKEKTADVQCVALVEDVAARGLTSFVPKGVKLINYSDFVDLIVLHDNSMNWE